MESHRGLFLIKADLATAVDPCPTSQYQHCSIREYASIKPDSYLVARVTPLASFNPDGANLFFLIKNNNSFRYEFGIFLEYSASPIIQGLTGLLR